MKTWLALIILSFSSPVFAASSGDLGIDVTDIQDPMVNCECHDPMDLGRICIRPTIYKHEGAAAYYPPEYFTRFQASVEPNAQYGYVFKLTSIAYYHQCTYAVPAITYVNDFYIKNFLDPEFYTTKRFDSPSVKGLSPQMRVALLKNLNSPVSYSTAIDGHFDEEKFSYIKGGIQEFYRINYPGTVAFKAPLGRLLSEVDLESILDDGEERIRYVKAWLIIHTLQDKYASFGEYTIHLRFYRKPAVKIARDLSNLGIEVIATPAAKTSSEPNP